VDSGVFRVVLILGGLLVGSTTALATPAFGELLENGYGIAPGGSAREAFHKISAGA
jgi:hypothetical protein